MKKSILIVKIKNTLSDKDLKTIKNKFEIVLGDEFRIMFVDNNFDFALISDNSKNILLSNIKEIDINKILDGSNDACSY